MMQSKQKKKRKKLCCRLKSRIKLNSYCKVMKRNMSKRNKKWIRWKVSMTRKSRSWSRIRSRSNKKLRNSWKLCSKKMSSWRSMSKNWKINLQLKSRRQIICKIKQVRVLRLKQGTNRSMRRKSDSKSSLMICRMNLKSFDPKMELCRII